jgi:hypothetical protein
MTTPGPEKAVMNWGLMPTGTVPSTACVLVLTTVTKPGLVQGNAAQLLLVTYPVPPSGLSASPSG